MFGTQVRVGPGGFAGFDYPAVLSCADRFEVDAGKEAFAQLRLIESWMLERQDRDRAREEEKARLRR